LLKEFLRNRIVLGGPFADMPQTALISGPSIETPGRPAQGTVLLGVGDSRRNRDRYCFSDLVL
jgi:hypothetical protein